MIIKSSVQNLVKNRENPDFWDYLLSGLHSRLGIANKSNVQMLGHAGHDMSWVIS